MAGNCIIAAPIVKTAHYRSFTWLWHIVYKGRPNQKGVENIRVPDCLQPEPKPHPFTNLNFVAKLAALALGVALMFAPLWAQEAATAAGQLPPAGPLPQDQGAAGLKEMLLRLKTTARMMHTTAH